MRRNHKLNRNHKLTGSGPLLDENGVLREAGWANSLVYDYSPDMVKTKRKRIKEWDYYLIINHEGKYAVSFTFDDNRYMGLVNCNVFDFEQNKKIGCADFIVAPNGSMGLPVTSESGNIAYKTKYYDYHIDRTETGRHIYCKYNKCYKYEETEVDIYLDCPPMDTMVIATPWSEDRTAFYYNQKITCMPAKGYVRIKDKTYTFDSSVDYGMLDWGRGVWTYSNTWYWGIGSGTVNGKPFGYNIGYGFGDTTNASENMLFYDGKCHKLDLVDFGIPTGDVMDTWIMTSSDKRFNIKFEPFFNDHTDFGVGLIWEKADKVFGRLNGTVVLDDGTVLEIKDMVGFHEKVFHKW